MFGSPRGRAGWILLTAMAVTALNSLKPLCMDDPTYYLYAEQISRHPLDPYGFDVEAGVPANHVLAPPVLLYWWAAGLRLFGEDPVAWKWWLFPVVLLFVAALHRLCRRLCP